MLLPGRRADSPPAGSDRLLFTSQDQKQESVLRERHGARRRRKHSSTLGRSPAPKPLANEPTFFQLWLPAWLPPLWQSWVFNLKHGWNGMPEQACRAPRAGSASSWIFNSGSGTLIKSNSEGLRYYQSPAWYKGPGDENKANVPRVGRINLWIIYRELSYHLSRNGIQDSLSPGVLLIFPQRKVVILLFFFSWKFDAEFKSLPAN